MAEIYRNIIHNYLTYDTILERSEVMTIPVQRLLVHHWTGDPSAVAGFLVFFVIL